MSFMPSNGYWGNGQMKWCWTLMVLIIFLGGNGGVLETNEARAEESDQAWVSKVVSVQGHVAVKRRGQSRWQTVELGAPLFAGDVIRVEAHGRAGIRLRNDAVIRLDQNTLLVFTEIEKKTTFIFKLLKGAANFFSRRPHSLKILTPFVNGVVEGTEFLVRVTGDRTWIELFEGRLLATNPHGALQLSRGHGVTALAGGAPQGYLLARPRDSVQWALYYPPVLAWGPKDLPEAFRAALDCLHRGRWLEALNVVDQMGEARRDPGFYTFRAALCLHLGSISEAEKDLRHALTLDSEYSEALSLQAVIAVVQNRREEAMRIAQEAVRCDDRSPAALLALSYARQARFDLRGALKAAETAVGLAPENGTARARLAELQLCRGRLDQGVKSAQRAASLTPNGSYPHTLLGFAYLTQIKTRKARKAFEKAISLDSAASLPRLGLGLAKIRDGALDEGRAEIEIAVGLDPVNALMRSYLGKAYFDEKRGPLDAKQLEIAKELDPKDPTPWLYDAIRKQTLNRPGEAVKDLQESIKLNDNRAVYRSRLLLDQDLAARSAALGRIYDDLSFQETALREGYRSLDTDPANYSAHRLLSDVYATRSRHEIARVSELLQSQLLQPLNLTPVQPQLEESNLRILQGAGPADPSFNEYNPLFTRDRVTITASGVAGENSTRGDEVTVAGIAQRLSYSFGQMYYETDGFRENNSLDQRIYNGFIQVALSPALSLQAEYRYKKTVNGDLRFLFDPDDFSLLFKEEREEHSGRIGFRYHPGPRHNFLLSFIATHNTWQRSSESILGENAFGPIVSNVRLDQQPDAYNGEFQYIYDGRSTNWIMGAGYYDADLEGSQVINTANGPIRFPEISTPLDDKVRHTNAYGYWRYAALTNLMVTLGLSFDDYDDGTIDEDQINPKFGISWSPLPPLTVRAAAFRTFKRSLVTNQTLEPTQVAGFNQFFNDFTGTDGRRYGVGIDYTVSSDLALGAEYTGRRAIVPRIDATAGTVTDYDYNEKLHRIYLNWLPHPMVPVSLEYVFEQFAQASSVPNQLTLRKLTTHQVPLIVSFFHPNGLFLKVRARYVRQEIEELNTVGNIEADEDQFVLVDAEIGWRLPKRFGILSLSATNLGDRKFPFFGVDYYNNLEPLEPEIRPGRQVLLKVTVTY
jgi:tetratricopeptide (TPR) repeat protein/opacity protein-like surface antigen